jgi:hypothetical protein
LDGFVTNDGSSWVTKLDSLECPHCGGRMKIISFIERNQHEVIERTLRGNRRSDGWRTYGRTGSHVGEFTWTAP